MSTAPVRPRVLVTGDVFVDHLIYAGRGQWPHSKLGRGALSAELPGGAALLKLVLDQFLPGDVALAANESTKATWPRGFAVFDRCAEGEQEVWRMRDTRDALGFTDPPKSAMTFGNVVADGDVVVIDDAGLTYRRNVSKPVWPTALRDEAADLPAWLVLKLHAPLAAGDMWHQLVADKRQPLRRAIAVIRADELRSEQVRIATALSWERTALDVVDGFERNPALGALKQCRFVVVRFNTDGALLAEFAGGKPPVYRLFFDPKHLEGDWAANVKGAVYGYHTVFTAALAAAAARAAAGADIGAELALGAMDGLALARRLLKEGHGPADAPPNFPLAALKAEFDKPTSKYTCVTVPADRASWSIADYDPSGAARAVPLYGLARRVAVHGVSALRGLVPYQKFGELVIVDRGEIESLRGLQRLVQDYAKPTTEAKKPLSIAVFGAPGAGKSFGVKELTRAVLGDKVPILEFNLAQFNDPGALVGLLHQVRDEVLKGQVPVVFWDEFDTGNLKWLPILLAPMQDGKIQDGQIAHPIGKCVFVFAGGTAHRFDAFGDGSESFAKAKGPDFKSRLAGYLDVLGPNQRKQADKTPDPSDVSFPVRRALQLRSNLGFSKKRSDDSLSIDRGVLTALLEVGEFRHGSRSLETIIGQAKAAAEGRPISRSHLPPRELLALHVDASEFLDTLGRDLKFPLPIEPVARAIHEFYRQNPKGGPLTGEPYEKLDEFFKDDNRGAARRMCDVLGLIGLYVVPAKEILEGAEPIDGAAVIARYLELLAEAEHEGWREHRERNGWLPAASTDRNGREHSCLRPWDELSENEKQKDRDAVSKYPEILGKEHVLVAMPPRGASKG